MDISKYEIIIKKHVFDQALARGIHPDMIEDALLKGKKESYGKHGIKFINKGAKRTIICVGEMVGTTIKIFTKRRAINMKKCAECSEAMQELKAKTPEGVEYSYYKCAQCGEEIVDMQQLHAVAETYRSLKKYNVKLSKWGMSLGLRIPKDLVKKYKLKNEEEVAIIPEKEGIKIIPA